MGRFSIRVILSHRHSLSIPAAVTRARSAARRLFRGWSDFSCCYCGILAFQSDVFWQLKLAAKALDLDSILHDGAPEADKQEHAP